MARTYPVSIRRDAPRRGAAGRSRARITLIDEALQAAREVGMNALAERAGALRESLAARPRAIAILRG